MKAGSIALWTVVALLLVQVLALGFLYMTNKSTMGRKLAAQVSYPSRWLKAKVTGAQAPEESDKLAFSNVAFTAPMDDRFERVKNLLLSEERPVDAEASLGISTRMGPPMDADVATETFVPDYAQAASNRFNTQMNVVGKVRTIDPRGLSPDMVIQPREVAIFGQSTQEQADTMGYGDGRMFAPGVAPEMQPLSEFGQRIAGMA